MDHENLMRIVVVDESIPNDLLALLIPYSIKRYPYYIDGTLPAHITICSIPLEIGWMYLRLISRQISRPGFYAHGVSSEFIAVAFPDAILMVLKGSRESAERARKFGRDHGIPDSQMRFEELFDEDHPSGA